MQIRAAGAGKMCLTELGVVVVRAQIQLPVVIHKSQPHTIKPTLAAKYVAREVLVRGEVNRSDRFDTKYDQSDLVSLGEEVPSNRAHQLRQTTINVDAEQFALVSLEDAVS